MQSVRKLRALASGMQVVLAAVMGPGGPAFCFSCPFCFEAPQSILPAVSRSTCVDNVIGFWEKIGSHFLCVVIVPTNL